MADAVLDASAILALLQAEPGAEAVADLLPGALVSTVNLSEVLAKSVEKAPEAADVAWHRLGALGLEVVDFDIVFARRAGELRALTRKAGLSFGDRACLALAERRRLPAITADRRWEMVDLDIDIRLLR